jgi:leader peptidase (prepilin peptidase)/N-methyltransferase
MAGEPLPLPWPAVLAFAGVVGACVGSFLNVVIGRVPAGESVVSPGSRCPRCRAPIAWYDNVPVVSWLVLRARCRRCGAPISARYPIVEALGAAVVVAALLRHGLALPALGEAVLVLLLLTLALIDLDTWLLPHALTWPLIALGLAAAAAGAAPADGLRAAAIGAAVGWSAFAALAWIAAKVAGREALGFGDVWLLAGIGAWLGVGALLPVVLLASVQGAVIGIALVALGRAQKGPEGGGAAQADGWVPPRNAVPFGPFLALGALEWLYAAGPLSDVLPLLEAFR